MERALFVACALVLCALPSAFGLNCTHCTPNDTNLEALVLCDNEDQYISEMCQGNNSHCARTVISGNAGPMNITTYVLGCFEPAVNQTCSDFQNVTCQAAENRTMNGTTITSCKTTCCDDKDHCNMPDLPTSAPTASSTEAGTETTTPTDAATVLGLVPQLMFVASMAAVYFGVK